MYRNHNDSVKTAVLNKVCKWLLFSQQAVLHSDNRRHTTRSQRSIRNLAPSWPPNGIEPEKRNKCLFKTTFTSYTIPSGTQLSLLQRSRVIGQFISIRPLNKMTRTYLQIIRQFGSTSVTRVHRDKDSARLIELQQGSFEQQFRGSRVDASLNGEDLLGYYGKHFQIDTVELVEARPCSARSQTLKKNEN